VTPSEQDELRGIVTRLTQKRDEDYAEITASIRQIQFLLGDIKLKPVSTPLNSPTGRKSKCVELARQRRRQSK
jgi:hypothetical protein